MCLLWGGAPVLPGAAAHPGPAQTDLPGEESCFFTYFLEQNKKLQNPVVTCSSASRSQHRNPCKKCINFSFGVKHFHPRDRK